VRVLLVEDTKTDRLFLLRELLRSPAIRSVVQVSSATNAIYLLQNSLSSIQPTFIVLDMTLANRESGFEVLRYLHRNLDIPVIVWTENQSQIFSQICEWFGVHAVVRKLVGANRNSYTIRHAIEEYAAGRERKKVIVMES
jgi:CheY-like chemotaxis protein